MDHQIIQNLFEFWTAIGKSHQSYLKTDDYEAVHVKDSDWPNRIFNVQNSTTIFSEIAVLSKAKELPEKITTGTPNNLRDNKNVEYISTLTNMALSGTDISKSITASNNIVKVTTEQDALDFSATASSAFGYKVGSSLSLSIYENNVDVNIFLFKEGTTVLGSGIIFFDSLNNAGLHMIGTVPHGRGKGIGRSMTEFLLLKAKTKGVANVVLHASAMGKTVYEKLGFKAYGDLETFKVV